MTRPIYILLMGIFLLAQNLCLLEKCCAAPDAHTADSTGHHQHDHGHPGKQAPSKNCEHHEKSNCCSVSLTAPAVSFPSFSNGQTDFAFSFDSIAALITSNVNVTSEPIRASADPPIARTTCMLLESLSRASNAPPRVI